MASSLVTRSRAVAVVLAVAISTLASGLLAPAADAAGKPRVTVMTRNLFLGADLGPAIAARTLPELMAANAAIFAHVQKVDFTRRAKVLAKEIADAEPDLLGLQEAAMWRTGPIGNPAPATTVAYDYLAMLRAELAALDAPYDVVISQDEADLEAPASAPYFQDIRLTQRDVILVKRGADLTLSNPRAAHFVINLPIPSPATGTVLVSTRGWTSVDVVKGKKPFRFVNTHLEAFNAQVRLAQAAELIAGPLALPPGGDVVLAGDLNSGPELPVPENRLAYQALVAGGHGRHLARPAPGRVGEHRELRRRPEPARRLAGAPDRHGPGARRHRPDEVAPDRQRPGQPHARRPLGVRPHRLRRPARPHGLTPGRHPSATPRSTAGGRRRPHPQAS